MSYSVLLAWLPSSGVAQRKHLNLFVTTEPQPLEILQTKIIDTCNRLSFHCLKWWQVGNHRLPKEEVHEVEPSCSTSLTSLELECCLMSSEPLCIQQLCSLGINKLYIILRTIFFHPICNMPNWVVPYL